MISIIRTFWGDLSNEDIKKFGLLSGVFFFIVGSYWLMRTMKNGLFMKIVGRAYLPYAKMGSLLFVICLVLFYAKLVDLLEKHKLIYLFSAVYAVVFLGVALALAHPTIGVANTVASPDRLLGWVIYFTIESFGSFMTNALFWSFVSSCFDTAEAKRGYPLIITGAQLGSLLGCYLDLHVSWVGLPLLFGLACGGIVCVGLMLRWFVHHYPAQAMEHQVPGAKKTGAIEGLRLLISRPYLMGVLGVATIYEIISAILEYQMNALADTAYPLVSQVVEFHASYGLAINALSFVFALIGTSFFIRRFGLTFCLLAYPASVACVILYAWSAPLLWSFFFGMVLLKGLSYALNNPCKEIMYIPTSKDVKFKAKGWIDTFGGRSAKGTGGVVNAFFPDMGQLLTYGSMISLALVGVWMGAAWYVGSTNARLVRDNKILE